jgi:hypothetical protein
VRRPIRGEELLDLAELLAGRNAGPGRPRTVHLRRAISSAYYALFHELVNHATARTVGAGPDREADRHAVTRWYAHGDIKTVSQWTVRRAVGQSVPDPIAHLLDNPPADLVAVADAFLALQEARHEADYDHTADVSRRDARAHVDRARDALARLPSLAGDRVYDNYLLLLLGGPRVVAR